MNALSVLRLKRVVLKEIHCCTDEISRALVLPKFSEKLADECRFNYIPSLKLVSAIFY